MIAHSGCKIALSSSQGRGEGVDVDSNGFFSLTQAGLCVLTRQCHNTKGVVSQSDDFTLGLNKIPLTPPYSLNSRSLYVRLDRIKVNPIVDRFLVGLRHRVKFPIDHCPLDGQKDPGH